MLARGAVGPTAAGMAGTDQMVDAFRAAYGARPEGAVRAPGRVNLIGEHTDYNYGFCLPLAIEREARIAWRARAGDADVRVRSLQEDGEARFALGPAIAPDPDHRWAHYVQGCAEILIADGMELVGCDLLIDGDVPLGAGLSSSAALEVAAILALLAAAGRVLDPVRIARLAQRAENDYVGTGCGILDQLSSACAQAGRAILMDCRSLALAPAPLPEDVRVVIADTGKRRELVASAYNERRAQCEAGAAALGVSHLRDATLHGLRDAHAEGRIDAIALDRCRHVVAENGRTVAAAACLHAGDAAAVGALMDQSHADLHDRFAVTCPELDLMASLARALPGCLGSRMTGAGFGGCTVSLVERDAADDFVDRLVRAYRERVPLPAAAYVTRAAAGAGELSL